MASVKILLHKSSRKLYGDFLLEYAGESSEMLNMVVYVSAASRF
jgi:hypothetical protein